MGLGRKSSPTHCSGRFPQSSRALCELREFCTDPEESLCCPCCSNSGSSRGVRRVLCTPRCCSGRGTFLGAALVLSLLLPQLGSGFLACGSPEQTFPVINCPAGLRSDQTTGSESGQEENQRDMDGMSHECGERWGSGTACSWRAFPDDSVALWWCLTPHQEGFYDTSALAR